MVANILRKIQLRALLLPNSERWHSKSARNGLKSYKKTLLTSGATDDVGGAVRTARQDEDGRRAVAQRNAQLRLSLSAEPYSRERIDIEQWIVVGRKRTDGRLTARHGKRLVVQRQDTQPGDVRQPEITVAVQRVKTTEPSWTPSIPTLAAM